MMHVSRKLFVIATIFVLLSSLMLVWLPIARTSGSQRNDAEQSNPGDYVSDWNYTVNLSPAYNEATGVAADSQNNIIVIGYGTNYSTRLQPCICLVPYTHWNVMKFDKDGNSLWNYTWGSDLNVSARASGVAVDSKDDFVVIGRGSSTIGEIMKFDKSNRKLWETSLTTGNQLISVAIDHEDNIIIPAGVHYVNSSSGAQNDGWLIMKFDENGNLAWNKTCFSSNLTSNAPVGVAIDHDNNIIVVGYDNATGSEEWRIMKFDKEGGSLWNYTDDLSPYDDEAANVAVDHENNIIVVGTDHSLGQNGTQWRIMKFDAAGTSIWNYTCFTSNQHIDSPFSVTVDSANSIIVAGYDNLLTAIGWYPEWKLVKLDRNGVLIWNYTYSNYNTTDSGNSARAIHYIDAAESVVTDHNDSLIVVGREYSAATDQQWRIMKLSPVQSASAFSKEWWFWTAIVVAVVALASGGYLLTRKRAAETNRKRESCPSHFLS
jgi:hypothetical protein